MQDGQLLVITSRSLNNEYVYIKKQELLVTRKDVTHDRLQEIIDKINGKASWKLQLV